MSTKVLYRKYRPTKLTDVVGQDQVTSVLSRAIDQNKIGHAYLFIGPRGTGKTSVARIFAHAVNGFDYQVEDSYLDIIEIDAASNTGVDNIRELREKAVIAPTTGKYKVYIIDEVHMLTKSASNALLKTLEEPPEHVIFILATTDAHKIPITISSRTQVHAFRLASPEIMLDHLRKIADQEGIKITDDALSIVVRRGGGSFRDSLSLLDQITTLTDDEITSEILEQALGLPQTQAINQLLSAYASGNHTEIHTLLQDLLNTGIKPETLASELITSIITRPDTTFLPLLEQLPNVQPPFPEAKLLLALLSTTPNAVLVPSPAQMPISQSQNSPQKSPISPQSPPEASNGPISPKEPSDGSPSQTPAPEPPKVVERQKVDFGPSKSPSEADNSGLRMLRRAVDANNFNWENFLDDIHDTNSAIYNQLLKVKYEFDGTTLHLYPSQKFTKSILDKPSNTKILTDALNNIALKIHEIGDHSATEDPQISEISAIMGGVQEIKGDMPF